METKELDYSTKAAQMWNGFSLNARAGVRFGLFPFVEMQKAEKEGYQTKELCTALMKLVS
jgi:hypothetical protein